MDQTLEYAAHDTDAAQDVTSYEPVEGALKAPREMGFDELMTKMHTQRPIFLKLLDLCREPKQAAAVDAVVDEMQLSNSSVYGAASLCVILERSGALARVFEDASPYVEEEAEPRVVVEDGVEYYVPTEPAKVFWKTTELGLTRLNENHPLARLEEMVAAEELYLPIYRRVAALAAREGGVATDELSEALDDDPLLQKPRYYAARFIDRLEKCEAICWSGESWQATEVGRAWLAGSVAAGTDEE